jgi:puromycin-sensitive aminopeptidase
MPAQAETRANGRKVVTFAESPRMSSYLLAVYAARLVPKSRKVGKTVITVWAAADQIAQADFALDAAENALKSLNRYFALPYQLPKLDLVAAPDFASGAMENWGAILFRDSSLLIDAKLSSEAAKRRVAEVVTHEIVHQWFGNLVTMKWWNDLWLNEAFATWLAAKIVDQWKPEWRVWDDFDAGKRSPLAIDALPGTRPVRSNAATPAEIQAMFDPITYQKGGALLRMLETYVGERAFRSAVRAYIRRYQYGNAEAGDLGRELQRASGKPVKRMMDGWLKQAGAPLVSATAGGPGGRTLTLSQSRFTAGAPADATLWSVPVAVRYRLKGETKTRVARVVLSGASQTLRLPGRGELLWAYPNADETGYYRLALSPDLLKAALAHKSDLTPSERAGLLNHLWAGVRAGTVPAGRFLDALAVFKGDPSRLVIEDAAGYLKTLSQQLAPDAASREKLREAVARLGGEQDELSAELRRQLGRDDAHPDAVAGFAADFFAPALARLGWDKKKGEPADAGLARTAALNALALLAPKSVPASEIDSRLAKYLQDPASIDAALAPVVLVAAARRNDPALFAAFRARLAAPKTPEQKGLMLRALAEFSAPDLLDQYLGMTLSNEIRPQDAWMPYMYLLANPATQARSWEFVKAHWKELVAKVGPRGGTRVVSAAGGLISPEWRKEVETFFRDPANEIEMARATLAQALDAIDLGLRFRQSQAGSFQEWIGLRADAPRLSRAGFKAFDRIGDQWSLSAAERAALLGVAPAAYRKWKTADAPLLTPAALERVSLTLGVYRRLRELLGDASADGWVKRPNQAFGGKPALELMTSPDSRELRRVRDHLAGVGGGWL